MRLGSGPPKRLFLEVFEACAVAVGLLGFGAEGAEGALFGYVDADFALVFLQLFHDGKRKRTGIIWQKSEFRTESRQLPVGTPVVNRNFR